MAVGRPTLTCWWQPEILPWTPAQSQHCLCRAVRGTLIWSLRCGERKKSKAGSRGCYSVLFVAATHCCRVVAAWRRSSPLFLSLSPSPFLSHTHKLPPALSLTHLLSASYTVLVHLSLPPPPPSCFPFSLPLARHRQNIDNSNVLPQLAVEINHSCKSQPFLVVVLHTLCMLEAKWQKSKKYGKFELETGRWGRSTALPYSYTIFNTMTNIYIFISLNAILYFFHFFFHGQLFIGLN